MAFCLSSIKGQAMTLCEARGYSDLLTEQLAETRMERETLEAMLTAIREALPDFRRYLRRKAELLGHPDGLPFYDLFAPGGRRAAPLYGGRSPRPADATPSPRCIPACAALMDEAFRKSLDRFLSPPRARKAARSARASISDDQSRVLTNFVGSFSDVSTLAHELGHGVA